MQYIGFMGVLFLCLIGCFSVIVWTPTVFECLICMRFYFCICTCSEQLSMFHMEKRSRNMLIIIINNIIIQARRTNKPLSDQSCTPTSPLITTHHHIILYHGLFEEILVS